MFSLDRDTVSGGDLLTVRYHVVPQVGGVLLTDATGAVLASAALTPSGKSLLRIPSSDRNRDLAVVLRATGLGGAPRRVFRCASSPDRAPTPRTPWQRRRRRSRA